MTQTSCVDKRKTTAPALSTSCSEVCCDVWNRDVAMAVEIVSELERLPSTEVLRTL